MIKINSEQYKVAQKIQDMFKNVYDVLLNIDNEEHFVGTVFPDIVLVDIKLKTPLFIIDIRKNGDIGNCFQQWKTRGHIPVTLYIIVPKQDIGNAKSIAAITGVNAKFGSYTLNENAEVVDLVFEP